MQISGRYKHVNTFDMAYYVLDKNRIKFNLNFCQRRDKLSGL